MSTLYNIVERVINADTNEQAESIFYGTEGIEFNRKEHYRNIISNFLKKRELLIKKEKGLLYFDLNNIHDIWNIIFLAEYIIENDEYYKEYQKELLRIDEEQRQAANDIDKELESCTKGSGKYIELSKRKSKVLRQDKNARIAMLKDKYKKTLDIFESPIHLVFLQKDTQSLDSIIKQIKAKNFDIDEMVFEKLKRAIYILYKLRNTFVHGEEILPEPELQIDKFGFKLSLPINYIDGFNRRKIIVAEKDKETLHKTNKITQPLLQYLGYDLKGIESFFYNVEPRLLSYLLEQLDYDYNKLYELPVGAFADYDNTIKLTKELGINIDEMKQLPDNAFDYPDTIKMLIREYGFTIEQIKMLPNHAFGFHNSIKILIDDYGYLIESLKDFSKAMFNYPNESNELLKKHGFKIEEISKLNGQAISHPGITEMLIKKYALTYEDINALHHNAFDHPETTQMIMDEYSESYKKIRELSQVLFTYPENLKLIIERYALPLETLNCIPIHILAQPQRIEEMMTKYGFTIEEIRDFSEYAFFEPDEVIKLLRDEKLTIKEIKEYGKLTQETKNLSTISSPSLIKTLIKEYGFTVVEIRELPESALCFPTNVIKLIRDIGVPKEEVKKLQDYAFITPEVIDKLIKEHHIPIEDLKYLPEASIMFLQNTEEMIKEYGMTYKELNGLPRIAFISPNLVRILIKEYGFTVQTLKYIPDSLSLGEIDQFFSFLKLTKGMNLGLGIYRKLNYRTLKEENLKFLIGKVGDSYEKLENFPSEFFECDLIFLEEMYKRYNSNLNKSIFGTDNVKVISLLIYMRSVFGRIDGKDIDVDVQDFIMRTNSMTLKHKDKMSGINISQNEYMYQIQNNNLLQKLRNMITHYRFKILKEEDGEESLLYLYDEDNQGTNNFNIIIKIKDLLELIKNIENKLVLQK